MVLPSCYNSATNAQGIPSPCGPNRLYVCKVMGHEVMGPCLIDLYFYFLVACLQLIGYKRDRGREGKRPRGEGIPIVRVGGVEDFQREGEKDR